MPDQNPMPFIGAFESTYLPAHDVDILETSGHVTRWREDLELLRAHGVTRLRYPIRWHRIETSPSTYDWAHTDEVMAYMRGEGFRADRRPRPPHELPAVADRRLCRPALRPRLRALLRGVRGPVSVDPGVHPLQRAVRRPLPLRPRGRLAALPPRGGGFVGLLRNVLPSIARVSRRYRELLPEARHVWVDSCEGHTALEPAGEALAVLANDRRFFALDAMLGRAEDRDRPFVAEVVRAGGSRPARDRAGPRRRPRARLLRPPRVGLRRRRGRPAPRDRRRKAPPARAGPPAARRLPRRHAGSPNAQGLAELILQYAEHTGLPLILGRRTCPARRPTARPGSSTPSSRSSGRGRPARRSTATAGSASSTRWTGSRCSSAPTGRSTPVGVIWLDEELARHGVLRLALLRRRRRRRRLRRPSRLPPERPDGGAHRRPAAAHGALRLARAAGRRDRHPFPRSADRGRRNEGVGHPATSRRAGGLLPPALGSRLPAPPAPHLPPRARTADLVRRGAAGHRRRPAAARGRAPQGISASGSSPRTRPPGRLRRPGCRRLPRGGRRAPRLPAGADNPGSTRRSPSPMPS